MRLIGLHCTPEAPIEAVLEPARVLFGGRITTNENGFHKLLDRAGAPIAVAAPLPGERERACEVISAPIETDHAHHLEALLATARRLNFRLPAEGAVHIHYDARRLTSAPAMRRLIERFHAERDALRHRFRPNPRCRRLRPWPPELLELVQGSGFDALSWDEARSRMAAVGLSKFCDFNITNIIDMDPEKLTFEVRILPPSMATNEIISAARYFADMLENVAAPR